MKRGKTLTELAKALEDIKATAKDYLVPVEKLSMNDSGALEFTNGETTSIPANSHAHGQIASYVGVPKGYYDKLLQEAPDLLSKNVNHGLKKQAASIGRGGAPETRMLRLYDGRLRAMLSSSYRRLDSYDLAKAVLPILLDEEFEVVSSEITERRMYIKALTPKVKSEVKKGDLVQYGLVISNSDVGAGSVRVEPLIYRLVCENGLISNTALRKFHVGKNMAGDDVMELMSSETISLTDQAFWAQVQDLVIASMRPDNFEREVNILREAAQIPIKNFDLPSVIDLSMKKVGASGEDTRQNILQYLANGADGAGLTKWGLANAYTYAAQSDAISYEQSIDLERKGQAIIDLSQKEWERIAHVH